MKAHALLDLLLEARVFHAFLDKLLDLAHCEPVGRADSIAAVSKRSKGGARAIVRPDADIDPLTAARARRILREHGYTPTVKP